jgi:hypothetical protein
VTYSNFLKLVLESDVDTTERLLRRFAGGMRVCDCGEAYLPDDCLRSSCNGNCETLQRLSMDYIALVVLQELEVPARYRMG